MVFQLQNLKGSLLFAHHARPFNSGQGQTLKDMSNSSLAQALPLLLSRKRGHNVLLLHYYVHYSFYPLHVYRQRVRQARGVIENAFPKHPELKIIIRGPHVIYDGKEHHASFGDNFGPRYAQIWREEFRGLHHRVWFLDLWDLSIAMENMVCHPPENIVLQMLRVLFGYLGTC